MRSTLVGVDRVRIGEDVLGVRRGPLHRDLERDLALGVLRFERDDLVVDDFGVTHLVEVFDVVDETPFVEEHVAGLLGDGGPVFLHLVGGGLPLVAQLDAKALVEECHLLEPRAEGVVLELDRLGEDRGVRPERDARSGLFGRFALLELLLGDTAVGEAVPPDEALLLDLDVEARRQRVHDGGADTVQTTGDGVGTTAELSTGVQDGEHDLDRRLVGVRRVRVDRDAATVVDDAHTAIREHRHEDRVGVTGQCLIDGVVDDLVDQVVESSRPGGPDVHAGALAHGFEAFEDLDRIRTVLTRLLRLGCDGALGCGGSPGVRFRLVSRGFRRHQRAFSTSISRTPILAEFHREMPLNGRVWASEPFDPLAWCPTRRYRAGPVLERLWDPISTRERPVR